jgi:hypothetical protein
MMRKRDATVDIGRTLVDQTILVSIGAFCHLPDHTRRWFRHSGRRGRMDKKSPWTGSGHGGSLML